MEVHSTTDRTCRAQEQITEDCLSPEESGKAHTESPIVNERQSGIGEKVLNRVWTTSGN